MRNQIDVPLHDKLPRLKNIHEGELQNLILTGFYFFPLTVIALPGVAALVLNLTQQADKNPTINTTVLTTILSDIQNQLRNVQVKSTRPTNI